MGGAARGSAHMLTARTETIQTQDRSGRTPPAVGTVVRLGASIPAATSFQSCCREPRRVIADASQRSDKPEGAFRR